MHMQAFCIGMLSKFDLNMATKNTSIATAKNSNKWQFFINESSKPPDFFIDFLQFFTNIFLIH